LKILTSLWVFGIKGYQTFQLIEPKKRWNRSVVWFVRYCDL